MAEINTENDTVREVIDLIKDVFPRGFIVGRGADGSVLIMKRGIHKVFIFDQAGATWSAGIYDNDADLAARKKEDFLVTKVPSDSSDAALIADALMTGVVTTLQSEHYYFPLV